MTVVINHVVIMKPVGDKSPDKENEKSGQEFQAKVDVEHWAGKDKCHDYELRMYSRASSDSLLPKICTRKVPTINQPTTDWGKYDSSKIPNKPE